jgi:crossover junction endodeoxyribonuclease RusA
MIAISLPWPDRKLHPNAREHWSKRAKAAKHARATAYWCAKEAGIRLNDPDIPAALKVTAVFFPPNNHKHDIDGCLSALKASFDGIADAIGIDDSKWEFGAPRKEAPVKGGAVRIELEAA